jgi:hypothetical protein
VKTLEKKLDDEDDDNYGSNCHGQGSKMEAEEKIITRKVQEKDKN